MIEATWPALNGWIDQPNEIGTRRAVYGKVHRAPTDYRWIAWSSGYEPASLRLEKAISLGIEEPKQAFTCWRCSPETGPLAIRVYTSRAFDAAGRSAGVERQILAPLPGPDAAIPPAALAFLLLGELEVPEFKFDDSIWWESWRDPAWESMAHSIVIPPELCPAPAIVSLEDRWNDGIIQLLSSVEEEKLILFYAQLLSPDSPVAVLECSTWPLPPLGLAALLLPLPIEVSENLSIAGGSLYPSFQASLLSNWNAVICAAGSIASPAMPSGDLQAAKTMVEQLQLASRNHGQLPIPQTSGELWFRAFLESEGRWIAPGKMGVDALKTLGPWPTVTGRARAAELRALYQHFLTQIDALANDPLHKDRYDHLQTKAELLLALLVVLCPGPEVFALFQQRPNKLVPALTFISRIEDPYPHQVIGAYTDQQLSYLVSHSREPDRVRPFVEAADIWLKQNNLTM